MTIQVQQDEVYSFLLHSGQEIVARVQNISKANVITVIHPVAVAPGPQGIGLIPAMFTTDHGKTLELNTASVAMYAPTDETVKAKYIQATTGIKVPDKTIIMG